MKFPADLSAGSRVKTWLEQLGHTAVFSTELGRDPGDDELLAFAAAEGLVVVTLDRGFGKSVFTKGAAPAAIIVLPDDDHDTQRALLNRVVNEYEDALMPGAWVIATRGRIRVRKPKD